MTSNNSADMCHKNTHHNFPEVNENTAGPDQTAPQEQSGQVLQHFLNVHGRQSTELTYSEMFTDTDNGKCVESIRCFSWKARN